MRAERRRAGRMVRRRRRIGRRLDGIAVAMGLVLMPWQREHAVAWLDGERRVVLRGRSQGRSTLARVVDRAISADASPAPDISGGRHG